MCLSMFKSQDLPDVQRTDCLSFEVPKAFNRLSEMRRLTPLQGCQSKFCNLSIGLQPLIFRGGFACARLFSWDQKKQEEGGDHWQLTKNYHSCNLKQHFISPRDFIQLLPHVFSKISWFKLKGLSNFTVSPVSPVSYPAPHLLQAVQLHLSRFHSCCTGGHLSKIVAYHTYQLNPTLVVQSNLVESGFVLLIILSILSMHLLDLPWLMLYWIADG